MPRRNIQSITMGDVLMTDLELILNSQRYLKCRMRGIEPDALLMASWEKFYRVHNELIQQFAKAKNVAARDLDDCLQSVWMEVLQCLPDFRIASDRCGLNAWLYALVRSRAANVIREGARRPRHVTLHTNEANVALAVSNSDPAVQFARQWNREMIRSLLSRLRQQVGETNYQVVYMRQIQGKSVKSVAVTLGIKPRQVWYRQHRTLKKLRVAWTLLESDGEPIRQRRLST